MVAQAPDQVSDTRKNDRVNLLLKVRKFFVNFSKMTNKSIKQKAMWLSLVSLLSSLSIAGVTTFLLMADSSSLISDPCAAIKIILAVTTLFIAVQYFIGSSNEDSLFHEKPKTQMMMIFKSALLLIVMSLAFHCVAILFGAPIFTSTRETYHFAILMTVLVGLPCCVVAGPKPYKWLDIFTTDREPGLETVVFLTSIGALLGAWLGAIPIPLDWDRPWQKWPISCSVGCISGYSLGLFFASLYLPHLCRANNKRKSV